MATVAQCLYCFETLSANLEGRKQLTLGQVEELWEKYQTHATSTNDQSEENVEYDEQESASHTSTPASESSTNGSSNASKASATSSLSSISSTLANLRSGGRAKQEASPLFITWNTLHGSRGKSLRGCIGTFEPQEIEQGLRTYAITAALEDHRFNPIGLDELPSLEAAVTLLTDFETAPDMMAWDLDKHGIRISFQYNGRRYGATYLPDVALEQGWNKTETLISLMRKAGWNGRRDDWQRSVQDFKVVRYQGRKVSAKHDTWQAFRTWATQQATAR